ncbi:MAG: hypothetical protein RBT11_18670 [Desulfobacterales bacterium]|jgi:hypothetical protein|nr:hypothetical protein [Desulfobacterales bacterium]
MINEEAKAVLDSLSETDRLILTKDTLYKEFRADLIGKLRTNGVKIAVIQAISGLPRSTISRIGKKKHSADKEFLVRISDSLSQINMKLDKLLKKP